MATHPLTGRAIGSWLLSITVALVAVSLERDWQAVRLIAPQGVLVSILLLAGATRFSDSVEWGEPQAWIYTGGLVTGVVGGAVFMPSSSRGCERSPHAR